MVESSLLVMEDISHGFGHVRAVSGVSLAVPRGTTLALLGESGCGKSTLARIALGLLAPDAGTVRFDGEVLVAGRVPRSIRRRMNMVFQDAQASLDPRWPVADSVAEPLRAFSLRVGSQAVTERVTELLGLVGLPADIAARRPHDLSFGQAQRVAIARALASEPAFLVCDEPTSALDVSVQAQVLNLLRDLQARLGLTMLFISHDIGVVRHMADLVAVLHRGRLVEFGAADAVFATPRHPYTRQALAPEPDLAVAAPSGATDAGCMFRSRCVFAGGRCAREVPRLVWADGVAVACHAVTEERA